MDLKILHVSSPTSWRGGEQQLAYLMEELRGQGVTQHLFAARGGVLAEKMKAGGFPVTEAPKGWALDLRFAYRLARTIRRENPHFVHVHDSHAHTAAVLAFDLFRTPFVMILHRKVDFPVSKSFFSRYKYNHPAIRRILCVSRFVAEVLRPDLRKPDLIRVVPDGIDAERFANPPSDNILRKEFGIAQDVLLIGNVAAITQQKDYFTFVKTAERLLDQGLSAHFFIIGQGKQEQGIRELVKQKGLEASFTFTGFRTDITDVLPALDILLFTSETEGLGTSLLDAMAAHVPIVSTNAGGIPEVVEHGISGLLAGVKDAEGLATLVLQLAGDPALVAKLKKGGSERVRQFSKAATALATLNVYRQLLLLPGNP